MLPSTNTQQRLFLQQHLFQRRLSQQLALVVANNNGRPLPTHSAVSAAATASFVPSSSAAAAAAAAINNSPAPAATPSLSSLRQVAAAAAAVTANGHSPVSCFQQQQGQQLSQTNHHHHSGLLQRLIEVDQQERKLKRRLSEMQHQQQMQQQQQMERIRLQATSHERIERPAAVSTKECNVYARNCVISTTRNPQHQQQQYAEILQKIQQKALLRFVSRSALCQGTSRETIEDDESRQANTEGNCEDHRKDDDHRDDGSGEDRDREPAETASAEKPAASAGVSRKDARWREMYEELKEYRSKTGTCTVPRGYPENPRLASWVAEQRKQYKLMKDGRQSSITPERVELLNRVMFAWNAQEDAWKKHMRDLKSFREENGHCHCPLGDPKYPRLGLWVKEQRRHYTLMKQGKQSHMTEARCAELNAVGFCWDTHEATWLERLNELRQYKVTHGNLSLPTNYQANPKLGTWIHHQRRQYKKYKEGKPCHITAERIRALDSLGFVWHPRDKNTVITATTATSVAAAGVTARDPEPETAADLTTNLDLRPRKRQRKL